MQSPQSPSEHARLVQKYLETAASEVSDAIASVDQVMELIRSGSAFAEEQVTPIDNVQSLLTIGVAGLRLRALIWEELAKNL